MVTTTHPDVAYYYPATFWRPEENGWVKSLLLFFDQVSILLPKYMYGRPHRADPALVEPLEDLGLLKILEPADWVDAGMATRLAEIMLGLLSNGAFTDLDRDVYFHELSQSRMGYGINVDLADTLLDKLLSDGLAKKSEDGVSNPLHPTVRTTILVILGQLSRLVGTERGLNIHPTTNEVSAIRDLIRMLSLESMPSRDKVIALDLETVTFDMGLIPLDEIIQFRLEHSAEHKAYMRNLRGFLNELSEVDEQKREALLLDRKQELEDAAHDIRRATRQALRRNRPPLAMGIAGSAWSLAAGDPVGLALSALGTGWGVFESRQDTTVTAYSYLFSVQRNLK